MYIYIYIYIYIHTHTHTYTHIFQFTYVKVEYQLTRRRFYLRNTLETTQTLNIRGNLLSMLRKHRFSAVNYFASFLKLNFSREFHLTNCIKCGKCSAMEISLSRIMFRKNESQKLHEENFAQNFTRMVWNAGKSHCSLSVLF